MATASMGESAVLSPRQMASSPAPISGRPLDPSGEEVGHGEARGPRLRSSIDLQPLDMEEMEPLPPSEAAQRHSPVMKKKPNGKTSSSLQSHKGRSGSRSSISTNDFMAEERGSVSNGPLAARFVTVSSVLSRSGAAMPLSGKSGGHADRSDGFQGRHSIRKTSDEMRAASWTPPPHFPRRKTIGGEELAKRQISNGSALEALGALLLQRDSSGKVSNLSFTRYQRDASSSKGKGGQRPSTAPRAWLQGVRDAGAIRLGIRMPDRSDSGQTIAQRRARKQGFLFKSLINRIGQQEVGEGEEDGDWRRVGTKNWHPTYEVGRPKRASQTILPAPAPPSAPKLAPDLSPEPALSFEPFGESSGKLPRNDSVFGMGSAFALNDPPDAPPSPVAMPGAWAIGGPGWSRKSGDWREEGALLLPPPLLDDYGSDAKSFEGLLGVRRMREQERSRKQLEKLKARNRPAHKVGMLTAFSNFVKAAHAADKAYKPPRPADMLSRRHTEPMQAVMGGATSEEAEETVEAETQSQQGDSEPEVESASVQPVGESTLMRRSSSQPRGGLDTVYEADYGGREQVEDGRRNRNSQSYSRRASLLDSSAPRAPRLLPIHVSLTAPSTPFLLDGEDGCYEVGRSREPSAPPTPRLGPTLLSLPPSPWTHSMAEEHRFSMQLSMAPIYGPPGTPRLAPTSLEVAPSPFPISPSLSPLTKSPGFGGSRANGSTSGSTSPNGVSSPFMLSPRRSPTIIAANRGGPTLRKRRGGRGRSGDGRMTPSAMMDNPIEQQRPESTRSPSTRRSFLLWFLFGDLGLGTRSTIAAKASGSPLPTRAQAYSSNYGLLLGFAAHIYGFSVFLLAHLVDLAYRIAETLSMTFWFLRWMALNLSGQTVLARCVIDAYGLVQQEWQTVSKEDHEGKVAGGAGVKRRGKTGLSRWQVFKGMVELICLQDVTRDRYLEEGAGLEELQGWRRRPHRPGLYNDGIERVDLGARREADRLAMSSTDGGDSDRESSTDEEESDDDMVVTRQGPEILEFTKTPRVEARGYFNLGSSEGGHAQDSAGRVDQTGSEGEANRLLVKTIRWASRLAISAYGLHVTLVDLPATFTPSGNRFSRQTFAHLSRLHHEDVLHADIQTLDSDAYSPTFYLVRDLARKVVVVSVRGTQSLQDIIVDLEMVVEEVQVQDEVQDEGAGEVKGLFCHAGVLRAAKALLSRQSTLFKTLGDALEENKDFGIVFTGHSLGGAIASTAVLLLSKYVTGDKEREMGEWVTHDHSGLPAGRSIRAITFAHPATVNASLANRAARGRVPLVTSVVLGSDIIPRCGHGQARELRRVLGGLSRVRRRRKGDHLHLQRKESEEDDENDRIHIVTSWWRWRSIKRKKEGASKEEERQASRIEDDLWKLRCDVENDLYAAVKQREIDPQSRRAAGKVEGAKRPFPPSPWIGPSGRAKAPLHQLAARRQALDAITLQNEESISASGILVPAGRSILIYNSKLYRITSPLSFFSLPDFHPRMFAEHFPSAYETALLEDIRL